MSSGSSGNQTYADEVSKRLLDFSTVKSWSDLIKYLSLLQDAITQSPENYVPHHPQLVKRLNQCLHPLFPAGLHIKALETYSLVFRKYPRDKLIEIFSVLQVGVLRFGLNCRIQVLPTYLKFLREDVIPLAGDVPESIKDMLIGLLPEVESQYSEFYREIIGIVKDLYQAVGYKVFFGSLWKCFIEVDVLRISVLNVIRELKEIHVTDYREVTRAFSLGVSTGTVFVIREILDISNYKFPIVLWNPNKDISQEVAKVETHENVGSIPDDLGALSLSGAFTESIKQNIPAQPSIMIIDDTLGNNDSDSLRIEYNTQMLRHFILLFLGKEAGMNRRVFKWLKESDDNKEGDTDGVTRALKTYVNSTLDDLHTFFKLFKALSDSEGLGSVLMKSLLFDILEALYSHPSDVDKYRAYFSDLSHEDIWEIIYDEVKKDLKKKECDKKLRVILFACKELQILGDIGREVYLPFIGIFLCRNSGKVSPDLFCEFMLMVVKESKESEAAREESDQLENKKDNIKELGEALGLVGLPRASVVLRPSLLIDVNGTLEYIDEVYRCQDGGKAITEPVNTFIEEIELNESSYSQETLNTEERVTGPTNESTKGNEARNEGAESIMSLVSDKKTMTGGSNRNCQDKNVPSAFLDVIKVFVERFGKDKIGKKHIKRLKKFLRSNYKYKALINIFGIEDKELHTRIWKDYVRSDEPVFLMHYNVADIILENEISDRKAHRHILRLLRTIAGYDTDSKALLMKGIDNESPTYFDLFFRVGHILRYDTPEYKELIFSIKDSPGVTEYLVKRLEEANIISENFYYINEPDYQTVHVALRIIRDLSKKRTFIRELKEISQVRALNTQLFGKSSLRQTVISVLVYISLSSSPTNTYHLSIQRSALRLLYKLFELDVLTDLSDCRLPPQYSNKKVSDTLLERLKKIVSENKHDFVLVSSSLFLLINDHEFVLENCMKYSAEVLDAIDRLDKEKREAFYRKFISYRKCFNLEVLSECIERPNILSSEKRNEFYDLAVETILTEIMITFPSKDYNIVPKIQKVLSFSISTLCSLSRQLWVCDSTRFVGSLFSRPSLDSSTIVLIKLLDFRLDLLTLALDFDLSKPCERYLKNVRKSLETLSVPETAILFNHIKAKIQHFINPQNPHAMLIFSDFLLSAIRNDQSEAFRSSLLLERLLSTIEYRTSVESGVPRQTLSIDSQILSDLFATIQQVPRLINLYKNCLFGLLFSGSAHKPALNTLYRSITSLSGNTSLFSDAFMVFFRSESFSFVSGAEPQIISHIVSQPSFDLLSLLDELLTPFEPSYFSSSSPYIKIQSLKRLTFLVLSSPPDTFTSYAARIVGHINSLIKDLSLSYYVFFLVTAMIFRIPDRHLLTLYPVLVEHILSTLQTSDDSMSIAWMFRILDLIVWTGSPVFSVDLIFFARGYYRKSLIERYGSKTADWDYTLRSITSSDASFSVANAHLFCYRPLFRMSTDSDAFAKYLGTAPKFYDWVSKNFLTRDYKVVQDELFNEFTTNKNFSSQ